MFGDLVGIAVLFPLICWVLWIVLFGSLFATWSRLSSELFAIWLNLSEEKKKHCLFCPRAVTLGQRSGGDRSALSDIKRSLPSVVNLCACGNGWMLFTVNVRGRSFRKGVWCTGSCWMASIGHWFQGTFCLCWLKMEQCLSGESSTSCLWMKFLRLHFLFDVVSETYYVNVRFWTCSCFERWVGNSCELYFDRVTWS